jgi:hypothetical protein
MAVFRRLCTRVLLVHCVPALFQLATAAFSPSSVCAVAPTFGRILVSTLSAHRVRHGDGNRGNNDSANSDDPVAAAAVIASSIASDGARVVAVMVPLVTVQVAPRAADGDLRFGYNLEHMLIDARVLGHVVGAPCAMCLADWCTRYVLA